MTYAQTDDTSPNSCAQSEEPGKLSTKLRVLTDADFLSVEKPAQYFGGELNAIMKNEADVNVRFALAFPDTYEVGMSHIGIQILYGLINSDPHAWAERVYMPLPDMEQLLREKRLPLTTLEAKRPLSSCDVVGFSLQYELCATNILGMLELGHIPIWANNRTEEHPIIVGGGPVSYHPEPFADFFDLFFLGDAEEAIFEIIQVVREEKNVATKNGWRKRALDRLSKLEGIYVPTQFEISYKDNGQLSEIASQDPHRPTVTRRLLPSLSGAPFPKKPVVPNIQTVHNRLSVEVMRGCVRGCRFCQAGYLYRPQRERSPEEIVELVGELLPSTGFEELSLLSLSTADYCSIVPLLKQLVNQYAENDRLAISFPSTRVDALTPELLQQVQKVRRTGFTVAPEAGTQRLRDVINKGVTDEQILETCGNVFRLGWSSIKLYFMLGLPTETDEDLYGIIDIASRVKKLPEARGKDITVSVSTHVPKPHTPFQWAEQISAEETIRKQQLLAAGLRQCRVNFRYHDAYSSVLEGIFARGDRRLSALIFRAYELGCRLDAWTENLSEELWNQAIVDCNILPQFYLRERAEEEVLPWDHLSCGIPKSYFQKEYKRALKDRPTPDCLTQSCSICGACDYDVKRNVLWPRHEMEQTYNASPPSEISVESVSDMTVSVPAVGCDEPEPKFRVRLRYEKQRAFRFLGHLEMSHVFQRACRRAELPLAYSRGFHPMPRLSFGLPLQLGISSSVEYVDAWLTEYVATEDLKIRLNVTLPEGLRVSQAQAIPLNAPSLQDSTTSQRFRMLVFSEPSTDTLKQSSADACREAIMKLVVQREAKQKRFKNSTKTTLKEFLMQDFLVDVDVQQTPEAEACCAVEFTLSNNRQGGPKPLEVANVISGLKIGEYALEKVKTVGI